MSRSLRLSQAITLAALALLVMVGLRLGLALHLLSRQTSAATLAPLHAMFSVLPMLFAMRAGRWMDQVGPTPLLRLGVTLLSASVLLALFDGPLWLWYAIAAMNGCGFMLMVLASQHLTGHCGTPAQRNDNFARFSLGMSLAITIGPLAIGSLLEWRGFFAANLALLLASLVAALVVLFGSFSEEPAKANTTDASNAANHAANDAVKDAAKAAAKDAGQAAVPAGTKNATGAVSDGTAPGSSSPTALWHDPALLSVFIISTLLIGCWDGFMFMMPLYGKQLDFSPGLIGTLVAMFSISTCLVRFSLPLLARRFGMWHTLLAGLFGAGLIFGALALPLPLAAVMGLVILLGLALGNSQPGTLALLFQHAPAARVGEAIGLRVTLCNASQVVAPLLLGSLVAPFGVVLGWMLLAVPAVLAALVLALRPPRPSGPQPPG